jgi:Ca2+/Na+ antiporter
MWIGFSVSASIRIINGFHDLFPAVPEIPYGYRIDQFFTDKPWNAIGYTLMSFNMGMIGLTYFMPLNLSFSCWFFFWLTRGERMFASIAGWKSLYLNERASGAWLSIGLLALWVSRRHLIAFARHVFGLAQMNDSQEPMRYRSAVFMFFASFAILILFCYSAGMSIWAMLVFYVLYYFLAIAIARVRAELGPPYHEIIGINPRGMMVQMFGPRRLRGGNLTILTFLYPFNRCNRAHPMPCQIESLKIGERVGMDNRRLIQAIALATGVGAIATFWAYLRISYSYGVLGKLQGWIGHAGWESFNPLQSWLQYPQGTDLKAVTFMVGGFLFVFFLHAMRSRFLWWPLYPSGYVLSGASWGGMIYFWFPVMVSWLIKFVILQYGGLKLHRKAVFFFFGLILGDYIPRSIWSIVSLILKVYMPSSGAGWN